MEDIFTAIPSVGFPIVVAWYLLTRSEKKIERLSEAIEKNTVATNALIQEVKGLTRKR
jgi:hypothetical protein